MKLRLCNEYIVYNVMNHCSNGVYKSAASAIIVLINSEDELRHVHRNTLRTTLPMLGYTLRTDLSLPSLTLRNTKE